MTRFSHRTSVWPLLKSLLNCYAADCPMDENTEKQLTRLAMVGTSRLRRILRGPLIRHTTENKWALSWSWSAALWTLPPT